MKTFTKSLLATAVAALLTITAQAVTIELSIAQSIGYVDPGAPANASDEIGYITTLIGMAPNTSSGTLATRLYQRTSVSTVGLLAPIELGATKDDSANPDRTDIAIGIFDYALGKYGDRTYVWSLKNLPLVGGLVADAFTLPASVPNVNNQNGNLSDSGLSHLSRYDTGDSDTPGVPDSGSTVALLGLAVAALAFAKRKF